MRTTRFRYPALAALVTAGAFIGAWMTIPDDPNGVQASEAQESSPGSPRSPFNPSGRTTGPNSSGTRGRAQLTESDRLRPEVASGVLDLKVAGLTIAAGSPSHPRTVARLTRLNTAMVPTGADWSATAEVIDGAAAFGEVPVDQHFELLLTGAGGEELLKTTILGPGHGLSPEYASVRVSLSR